MAFTSTSRKLSGPSSISGQWQVLWGMFFHHSGSASLFLLKSHSALYLHRLSFFYSPSSYTSHHRISLIPHHVLKVCVQRILLKIRGKGWGRTVFLKHHLANHSELFIKSLCSLKFLNHSHWPHKALGSGSDLTSSTTQALVLSLFIYNDPKQFYIYYKFYTHINLKSLNIKEKVAFYFSLSLFQPPESFPFHKWPIKVFS